MVVVVQAAAAALLQPACGPPNQAGAAPAPCGELLLLPRLLLVRGLQKLLLLLWVQMLVLPLRPLTQHAPRMVTHRVHRRCRVVWTSLLYLWMTAQQVARSIKQQQQH